MNSELVVSSAGITEQSELMEATSGVTNPEKWFIDAVSGGYSDAGIPVTEYTVLTDGPVWHAVSLISADISTMTVEVRRKVGDRDSIVHDRSPAWRLLRDNFHKNMLAINGKETLMSWALLHGNGIAIIQRNELGQPLELIPVYPRRIQLREDPVDGEYFYEWWDDKGGIHVFSPQDVFHIAGLGNGMWGESVLTLMKNSVGFGLAVEQSGNKFFANSARPAGLLTTDQKLRQEEWRRAAEAWERGWGGLENTGRTALLDQGLKFQAMTVTHKDAEFIESRRFHREDIAHWFSLPAYKLNALENSSVRANLEEQNRDYLTNTLMKWLVKIEKEAEKKLLSQRERDSGCYVRFNTRSLLRPHLKDRYEAYGLGRQWGFLSANDVRALEDMDSIGPSGDSYLQPLNMMDADHALSLSELQVEQQEKNLENPPPQFGPPGDEDNEAEDEETAEDEEDEEDEDEDNFQRQAQAGPRVAMTVLADRITRIESGKAKRMSEKPKVFIDWVGTFRDELTEIAADILRPAADILEGCGLESFDPLQVAAQYSRASMDRLDKICDQVTYQELPGRIKDEYADNWRQNLITDLALGENHADRLSLLPS